MKNPYHHYLILFLFAFICGAVSAQPVTANEYVPPYNEKFDYGSNMWGLSNGWSD